MLFASRSSGMHRYHKRHPSMPPSLDYDGLYRILKWSMRFSEKLLFSKRRGTTCANFVIACHQSAAMYAFLRGFRNYTKLFEAAKHHRAAKPGKPTPHGSLYANNLVGTRNAIWAKDSIESIWDSLCRENGASPIPLEIILTPELMVDAKFIHPDHLPNCFSFHSIRNWKEVTNEIKGWDDGI